MESTFSALKSAALAFWQLLWAHVCFWVCRLLAYMETFKKTDITAIVSGGNKHTFSDYLFRTYEAVAKNNVANGVHSNIGLTDEFGSFAALSNLGDHQFHIEHRTAQESLNPGLLRLETEILDRIFPNTTNIRRCSSVRIEKGALMKLLNVVSTRICTYLEPDGLLANPAVLLHAAKFMIRDRLDEPNNSARMFCFIARTPKTTVLVALWVYMELFESTRVLTCEHHVSRVPDTVGVCYMRLVERLCMPVDS
jgi:hypothetical protein